MPKPTLAERVEQLERKLEELEDQAQGGDSGSRKQDSGTEAAKVLDRQRISNAQQLLRDAKKGGPTGPGLLERKGVGAVSSSLVRGGATDIAGRSGLNAAVRAAGGLTSAPVIATAAATAAPLALEAIAQISGSPALSRAADVLGQVLPVQRLADEVSGAQSALSTALAFGRAGVGLSAQQLMAGQERARQLSQRERTVARKKNVGAIRRQAAALGQTLGQFDPGDPTAEEDEAGEGFGIFGGRAKQDADIEAAFGRVGSLVGQEEAARRAGRAVESAVTSDAAGAILDAGDPLGLTRHLSGEADEPRKLDPMKARRILGLGSQ